MGSIQHRPNRPSPWRARVRTPRGKQISKSFDLKREARDWIASQETAMGKGEWVNPKSGEITFGLVADRWTDTRDHLRPATRNRDESVLQNQVLPHFGDMAIKAIQPSDVQRWVNTLSRDYAPATVIRAYQIVGQIFKLAVRDRLISSTPADGINLPSLHRDEPRFIGTEDVLKLAHHIGDDAAMVLLGAFAGLRIGEVLGLQVEDVDFLARKVTVRRTVSDVKGGLQVGPPKTRKSRRTVAVPSLVTDALAERARALGASDFIFQAPEGGPIHRRNWTKRVWKPATKRAELEGLRFHDLRHSHVAMLIDQGAHPRQISDRLGHVSVKTVLDTYGHILPGADDEIAAQLDERLASVTQMWPKPADAEIRELGEKRETPGGA